MKKIIIILLCLSSLLCFARIRICADCADTESIEYFYDGPDREICVDCKIKKEMKSQEKEKEDDFDLGWGTVVCVLFVIAVIKIVCSKKHSSPRNSFRNNKVDKKSTNTSQNADNCNQNTAENVVNKCSFVFPCPHCNCKLESDTEWIGMECECPLCHKKIVIPPNSTNL